MRTLITASAHDLISRNCLQWACEAVPNLTTIALELHEDSSQMVVHVCDADGETIYGEERQKNCLTCATIEVAQILLERLTGDGPVLLLLPGGIELTLASAHLQEIIESPIHGLKNYRLACAVTAVDTQVALELLINHGNVEPVRDLLHTCRLDYQPSWEDDSDSDVVETLTNDLLYADQVVYTGDDAVGQLAIMDLAAGTEVGSWQQVDPRQWCLRTHDVEQALGRVNSERF
ncbi:MAG: hypothetical protein Q4P06_04700 [Actinomycetaceae bacterium]|nr:hypothetical protein [Actinomycetaceae bacterium]